MTIEERIDRLEQKIEKNNTKIRKLIKTIKGMKMAEEFDFDTLLDEIDEVKNEETNGLHDNDNVSDDLDILDDDISTVSVDDKPEVSEDFELQGKGYKTIIKELEQTIDELKSQLKIAKTELTSVDKVSYDDLEFSEETKSFLKAHADLELEKKELQDRFKELKTDYEEQGVHTKEALKAWKEIQKQFKETPEEAKEIEQMKSLIQDDDTLHTLSATLSD